MFKTLNVQIFLGIFLGVLAGVIAREEAVFLQPIGEMFIRLLKMLIIPLVSTSIIIGVVNLGDIKHLSKLGGVTALFFIVTTVIAASIGIFSANFFQPGLESGIVFDAMPQQLTPILPSDMISIFTEIVPENVFADMAKGKLLPFIFFSILLGAAFIAIGRKGEPVIKFFDSLNDAILKMVGWVMKLAPIGVFALIADMVSKTGLDVLMPLGLYIGTVIAALAVHAIFILPMILMVFARYSPIRLLAQLSPALAMAFSTNSSIAALPVTMDCLNKKTHLPNRITSFVCPLGATINMDGTAIYQAVTALFIAQIYGIQLSLFQLGVVIITATLASIGAAALPSAGLITVVIILNTLGLPLEAMGLILAVDRIMDMFRTMVNVFSDGIISVIIARREGELIE